MEAPSSELLAPLMLMLLMSILCGSISATPVPSNGQHGSQTFNGNYPGGPSKIITDSKKLITISIIITWLSIHIVRFELGFN
jgi:hypothetical protein